MRRQHARTAAHSEYRAGSLCLKAGEGGIVWESTYFRRAACGQAWLIPGAGKPRRKGARVLAVSAKRGQTRADDLQYSTAYHLS